MPSLTRESMVNPQVNRSTVPRHLPNQNSLLNAIQCSNTLFSIDEQKNAMRLRVTEWWRFTRIEDTFSFLFYSSSPASFVEIIAFIVRIWKRFMILVDKILLISFSDLRCVKWNRQKRWIHPSFFADLISLEFSFNYVRLGSARTSRIVLLRYHVHAIDLME